MCTFVDNSARMLVAVRNYPSAGTAVHQYKHTTPANTCNLQAPRLLTSTRNRPRSCKSQQEIEEEELQQQFKARPVEYVPGLSMSMSWFARCVLVTVAQCALHSLLA